MQVTYLGAVDPAVFQSLERLQIPLYSDLVSAGFPSPAQDYVERSLDLNELCIQHPNATFFVRAQGDSMIEAGIYSNDVLVVDRSLTAKHGDIVIAALFGELTVKELCLQPSVALRPRNPQYPLIPVSEDAAFEIFGVVTGVVRKFTR
ncbi:translesion error-prone DNA polymerase V autoproteolytic subunit [Marinomonas ostreistagni]|uniref:translesion error-prone DNA polymerase V autoproteolytic subunit n=1 Tax=Marinomonas ostreistagni TaxID=359209 RepID=UPI0019523AB3|nr:translesion error-prone DNA polymerase V autoproteolytic subunit [Marinomonas ostreistagni]MBM6550369.1 translesion error-prone DNA polymerase V autoproteolytic subunit [Marinomonas ostreistagni]